jgi:hypothetical protein
MLRHDYYLTAFADPMELPLLQLSCSCGNVVLRQLFYPLPDSLLNRFHNHLAYAVNAYRYLSCPALSSKSLAGSFI